MKKKTLIKIVVALIVCGGVAAADFYFLLFTKDKAGNTIVDETFGWKFPVTKFPLTGPGDQKIAYSDIRDPGGIPQGLPVRLKIPGIQVDSAIEDATITSDGRMDVPIGSKNVAWFSLGPHPGKTGSAVIGGHFGISKGVKFVFYDLDKLRAGDVIYIEDDRGDTLTFQVREIKLFERDADATTVFTSDDGKAHLNLITCEGVWNKINDTYPLRRVVFTDLVPTPSTAPVSSPEIAIFQKTLSIGARGEDVVALQLALIQKGFLTIPPTVPRGYYGALTRTAVAKYQAAVGLPADGVFGQLTRAKLVLEQSLSAVRSKLPATAITEFAVSETPVPSVITSFFATPRAVLITSTLLILTVFVSYKIVRRYLL